jgi:hypothetical protein
MSEGFIEQNHPRFQGENCPQDDALFFSAGKRIRRAMHERVESDQITHPGDPALDLVRCQPEALQSIGKLSFHGLIEDLSIRVLEGQSHMAEQLMDRMVLGVQPVYTDPAFP